MIEQQRFMCAIGAMQTVVAIPRALPILHSGPGCGTMVAGFFERSTGYSGGSTAPCTNFSETDVVFGGEKKLREIIRHSYQVLESDLQVVLTGCTSAIIGDNAGHVVKEFGAEGKPIVFADTPGFKCSNYEAHSIVVNAIIDQYTDRFACKKAPGNARLVNLFASVPYQDPFWKGNLGELKRLIEGIGLEVQILFGPESKGVPEWRTIPQANFNILVSPWYGLPIVEHLEEKYGQRFFRFPYLPIGGNETSRFLRELAGFANERGAGLSQRAVEKFIEREERIFYEEIDNLATFLLEFRYGLPAFVHILHDSGYVLGMAKFLLYETGIVPREQFITDNTPERYQREILDIAGGISPKRHIPVYFYPDAGRAQEVITAAQYEGRGLVIGSGWDKETAAGKNYDFLSAALPSPYRLVLTSGYAGYRGGLRLIEDIYNQALGSYR
ncbi:MAG: hydrogenase [Treponema sp.]|jgi:nitrogenase molybdenum-iron protein beta chain|nr:hydrogenase [Treponema sp.]